MWRRTGKSRQVARGWLLELVVTGLLSHLALAQDAGVRAYVDRTEVQVGDRFVLSVEMSGGATSGFGDPVLPDLKSFADSQGSGRSQQVRIVNGRTSTTYRIDHYFVATRAGEFTIGPVQVEAGGVTYSTDPIRLTVTSDDTHAPGGGASEEARSDLFILATANRPRAYQNQAVVVTYKIYTLLPITSFSFAGQPETSGFWVEDYTLPESPPTRTEIVGGRQYTVATIKRMALFPTTSGHKEVGPLGAQCQVRMHRRTRSLFDDFFSQDLFARTATRSLQSNRIDLEVLPLPAQGKPADFSGAVGDFQVTARIQGSVRQSNQALTLKVSVTGNGNIQQIAEPALDLPEGFEVYPPEVKQQLNHGPSGISGHKDFEYVIIPRKAGSFHFSPVSLAYFDPEAGTYKRAKSDELTFEIEPAPEAFPEAGAPLTKKEVELIKQDIRFIKSSPGSLYQFSRKSPYGFWVLLLAPLMALGGAALLRQHQLRLKSDVAYARRRRASRLARSRLKRARSVLEADENRFFSELDRALAGFIGDKLNLPEASLQSQKIRAELEARGVDAAGVEQFLECRRLCDLRRFSPGSTPHVEREQLLNRVETCLVGLADQLQKGRRGAWKRQS